MVAHKGVIDLLLYTLKKHKSDNIKDELLYCDNMFA